jgi:hypothetical protein
MHAGLGLVALDDGRCVLLPLLDLVVLLDEGAGGAPERHAAVAASTALDVVSFANLTTLNHGVTTGSAFVSHGRNFKWSSTTKSKVKKNRQTYIHPQPVKQVRPPWIMQSEFSISALCIDGSRIRSDVWPSRIHGMHQANRHDPHGLQLQRLLSHSVSFPPSL